MPTENQLACVLARVLAGAWLCLALAACAGSNPPGPKTAASVPGEPASQALPALPADPEALITGDATELARVDLAALRGSEHFPLLHRWATQLGCLREQQGHWLLDRTERVIAASFPPDAGSTRNRGLFLLSGELAPGTLQTAITQGGALLGLHGGAAGALETQQRGRFELVTSGALAGVHLGDGLLALGDRSAVEAMLALADGQRSDRFIETPLYVQNLERLPPWAHPLSVLSLPSPSYRARVSRQLAKLGAGALVDGLRDGSLVATAELDADLDIRIEATYESAQAAEQAASAARQVYFQGNLLLRLTGMPRVFERARAEQEGERVRFSLGAEREEIGRLAPRLSWLVEAAVPKACGGAA